MGVTRLKRKDRKNKARANNRVAKIKQLLSTPVIKNVDVEELKANFNQSGEAKKAEKAPAASKPKASAPVAPKAAAPEVPAPSATNSTVVPAGTPSADEVFEAVEKKEAKLASEEADALEPGAVETAGEQFVRNQLADTTTNTQNNDIDAIKKVEDDENDIQPKV
jgi:hypothetical protein